MRQELSRPEDVQDPLQVLADIVGQDAVKLKEEVDKDTIGWGAEWLEEDVDFSGLSLDEYLEAPLSKQVPSQDTVRSIQTAEECGCHDSRNS